VVLYSYLIGVLVVYERNVIQSFVIKIRLTDASPDENALSWYGFITHVPTKNRQYFSDLNEIAEFIRPYLEQQNNASYEHD
jgi:hypothetical protein